MHPILPFKDGPPYYSLKSWATFMRDFLKEASQATAVVFVYHSCLSSVDPEYLGTLDFRFYLNPLRPYLRDKACLPGLELVYRDESGAFTSLGYPSDRPYFVEIYTPGPKNQDIVPNLVHRLFPVPPPTPVAFA